MFPLFHYRRDADTHAARDAAGRLGRTARTATAGFLGPYFWFKNANLDARFVPLLYTDVRARSDGQHLTQWGPWFRVDGARLQGRRGCSRSSATTTTRTRATPGSSRRTSACVAPTATQVDALLPLFWRSSFGGRTHDGHRPLLRAHDAGSARASASVPLFVHARNAERTHDRDAAAAALFAQRHNDGTRDWFSCALFFHDRDPTGRSTRCSRSSGRTRRGIAAPTSSSRSSGTSPTRRATARLDAGGAVLLVAPERRAHARPPAGRLVLAQRRQRRRLAGAHAALLRGARARPLLVLHAARPATTGAARRSFWYAGPVAAHRQPGTARSRCWRRSCSATRTRRPRRRPPSSRRCSTCRAATPSRALQHAGALLAPPRHRDVDLRRAAALLRRARVPPLAHDAAVAALRALRRTRSSTKPPP